MLRQNKPHNYNELMRSTFFTPGLFVRCVIGAAAACQLVYGVAQVQTPSAQLPTTAASATQRATPEPLTESIRIEDASTRIDEVRVGGETRSITVQPKGGMPSYQVAPVTGDTRWKVLGF